MSRINVVPWVVSMIMVALTACGTATDQEPEFPSTPSDPPPISSSAAIAGHLLDAEGIGIPDVQVTAISTEAAPISKRELRTQATSVGTTNEHGQFELFVTESGTYTVTAKHGSHGAIAHVTLEAGDDGTPTQQTLELTAGPLGAIEGQVTVEGASEPSEVLVYALGTSFMAMTNGDGEFVVRDVPAGTYTLAALKDDLGLKSTRTVEVTGGKSAKLSTPLELQAAPAPVITGASPALVLDGETIVIKGSGFGDGKGISVLEYAGTPIPSRLVTEWADDRIEVRYESDEPYLGIREADLDERVFTVRTPRGEAETPDPVQLHRYTEFRTTGSRFSESGEALDLEVFVQGVGGPVVDLPIEVASDQEGAEGGEGTLGAHGEAVVPFTPASTSPHVVTLSHDGRPLAELLLQCCEAWIESTRPPLVGESTNLRGSVFTFAGEPLADTKLEVSWYERDYDSGEVRLVDEVGMPTTDGNGEFELSYTPKKAALGEGQLVIALDGVEIGSNYFPPTSDSVTINLTLSGEGDGNVRVEPLNETCDSDSPECELNVAEGEWLTFYVEPDENSYWIRESTTFPGDFYCDVEGSQCDGSFYTSNVDLEFAFDRFRTLMIAAPDHGTIYGEGLARELACGSGGEDCTINVPAGTTLELRAVPDARHMLGAWSGPCDDAGSTCTVTIDESAPVDEPIVLGHEFVPVHTLTVLRPELGMIDGYGDGWEIHCGSGGDFCTAEVPDGTTIRLRATPDDKHHVGSWGDACHDDAGDAVCTLHVNADTEITHTFEAIYTLAITRLDSIEIFSQDGSIACYAWSDDCEADYRAGEEVILNAYPALDDPPEGDEGYVLEDWGVDCHDLPDQPYLNDDPYTCVVRVDEDVTVDPEVGPGVPVEIVSPNHGLLSVNGLLIDHCGDEAGPCVGFLPRSTEVTLHAYPDEGYELQTWNHPSCHDDQLSCTIVIDEPTVVEPIFALAD